jgi:aminoglycoside 6'-N-acetyltransferase-1b/aminoglycoside 6'-N-acetyltransferase-2
MHRWLNNPEVSPWYGLSLANVRNLRSPTLQQVTEHYTPRMRGESPTCAWTIRLVDRRIGYIQCYRTGDWPSYAETIGVDPDAFAIDLYIGEDDARGAGRGTAVLRRFVAEQIFSHPGVTTVVMAPSPDNARAIRCYEKAGFQHVRTVWVEESAEEEYVMVLERDGGG